MRSVVVIQQQGEEFHEKLEELGHKVLWHSNDPRPWLDDLQNALGVDCIVVSPVTFAVPNSLAAEVATELVDRRAFEVYLAVNEDVWLKLEPGDA